MIGEERLGSARSRRAGFGDSPNPLREGGVARVSILSGACGRNFGGGLLRLVEDDTAALRPNREWLYGGRRGLLRLVEDDTAALRPNREWLHGGSRGLHGRIQSRRIPTARAGQGGQSNPVPSPLTCL